MAIGRPRKGEGLTPALRAYIVELAESGYSLYRIAKMLNEAGVPTPGRGLRGWQIRTVGRALGRYSR